MIEANVFPPWAWSDSVFFLVVFVGLHAATNMFTPSFLSFSFLFFLCQGPTLVLLHCFGMVAWVLPLG